MDRRLDGYHGEQIALAMIPHCRDTFATQSEYFARLGPGRNLERHVPIERWQLNFTAQRGSRYAHRDFTGNICAFAIEDFIRLDANFDIKIAGWAAIASCLAFAG